MNYELTAQLLNLDRFLEQYGDHPHYELIDGELIDLEPTGKHEEIASFIGRKLNVEIDRQNLPYLIPYRCLIKLLGTDTALRPDLMVLNQTRLFQEPLWQREPIVCLGSSIPLVVEVVSSNWQNDYARKVEDYALLGIPEYWIVDYLGVGGRDYIGSPKQPTLTLCTLVGDRYQKQILQGNTPLLSPTFPDLGLRVDRILTLPD